MSAANNIVAAALLQVLDDDDESVMHEVSLFIHLNVQHCALYTVFQKKGSHFYFLNSSVRHWPICGPEHCPAGGGYLC